MEERPPIWRVTANIMKSPHRSGSLMTAARELARHKLDLVCVQVFGWDKGGTVRAGDYILFYKNGNENHQLGTEFLYTTEEYQQLE
jgi:hypothetical protein